MAKPRVYKTERVPRVGHQSTRRTADGKLKPVEVKPTFTTVQKSAEADTPRNADISQLASADTATPAAPRKAMTKQLKRLGKCKTDKKSRKYLAKLPAGERQALQEHAERKADEALAEITDDWDLPSGVTHRDVEDRLIAIYEKAWDRAEKDIAPADTFEAEDWFEAKQPTIDAATETFAVIKSYEPNYDIVEADDLFQAALETDENGQPKILNAAVAAEVVSETLAEYEHAR